MNHVYVSRTRCRVLVRAAAGVTVALSYPALPLPGGDGTIRPALIASTSAVLAPSLAPQPVGQIAPALIGSTSAVGAPVLAGAAAASITFATIAAASAVLAPTFGAAAPNPSTVRANSTAVRANHGNFSTQLLSIQQQIAALGG